MDSFEDKEEAVTVDVTSTVVIQRSPEVVWNYLIDYQNDPQWIGGVRDSRLLDAPPLTIGSKVNRTATFLGRRFDYVTEITALDPSRRVEMQADRPFEMLVTYEIDGDDNATTVRVRNRGDATGFYRLASPFLARALKRNVDRDLKALKSILESSDS